MQHAILGQSNYEDLEVGCQCFVFLNSFLQKAAVCAKVLLLFDIEVLRFFEYLIRFFFLLLLLWLWLLLLLLLLWCFFPTRKPWALFVFVKVKSGGFGDVKPVSPEDDVFEERSCLVLIGLSPLPVIVEMKVYRDSLLKM